MKNSIAIMAIHRMLRGISVCVFSPRRVSVVPVRAPRVRFTMCVRGRAVNAMPWMACGREDRGKNVPLKKSIGVIKRNIG